MIGSKTLSRPSPLPGGERSDRVCAIRVRGKPSNNRLHSPLTRNVRAKRAYSDLSPMGRGEEGSLNVIGKCSNARRSSRARSIQKAPSPGIHEIIGGRGK